MSAPKKKTLKPAEGRLVPLEDGRPWPTEEVGKGDNAKTQPKSVEVILTRFYRRRLKDGDLIDVNAPKDEAELTENKSASQKREPAKTETREGN